MIFLTVGTSQFPFERVIRFIDEAVHDHQIERNIFAQVGSSLYKPRTFPYKEFLDFNDMAENTRKSDIIVTHAGVGSIMLAFLFGKIPVVIPRRHDLKEVLDNHQFEFAKKMEEMGKVIVAYEESALIDKINNYKALIGSLRSSSTENNKASLIAYLDNICR